MGGELIESLRGLPALLHYLGSFPDPDGVAHAIVSGPIASFGASDVLLMNEDGAGSLLPLGWNRSIESLNGRVPPVPITSDLPIARAYREGEPLVIPSAELQTEYPGMMFMQDLVGSERMPRAHFLVAAPVSCLGRSVGGFGAWVERSISTADLPLMSALPCALGLWMTHGRTQLGFRSQAPAHLLSERQLAILILVGKGNPNRAIAAQLDYSESTVKLEISRILAIIRARDRQDAVRVARSLHLLNDLEENPHDSMPTSRSPFLSTASSRPPS